MSYLHIPNLYKDPTVLMFRECYALEKVHGTSSRVTWSPGCGIRFSPGGGSHEQFVELFNVIELAHRVAAFIGKPAAIHGEFYGGVGLVGMGMRRVYGDAQRFVVFDVKVEDSWLAVPQMQNVCDKLGLEAVHWRRVPATIEAIDAERDSDSVQAIRNGMGEGHVREGVVLRPLIELVRNNGQRVIAKHRRPEFSERAKEPAVNAERTQALEDARAIADEWVVPMRLSHVLGNMQPPANSQRDTARVIAAMTEDVRREAEGEIVWSREAQTAIGTVTASLFQEHLKAML